MGVPLVPNGGSQWIMINAGFDSLQAKSLI